MNGIGQDAHDSLADELANAWDDDGEAYEDVEEVEPGQLDGSLLNHGEDTAPLKHDPSRVRDSGVDVLSPANSPTPSPSHQRHSSKSKHVRKHSRKVSQNGKVTEPASPKDNDLSRSLVAAMKDVEVLAASAADDDTIHEGPEPQDPYERLSASLQSLGGQQNSLESNATRLITAHTSLSLHLAHQTRTLQSMTYFFLSPLPSQPIFGEEEVDGILDVLKNAIAALPQPTIDALTSMNRLSTSSKDAIASLASLSDSLHMSRQNTSTAARKLRVTKDMVTDMRNEQRRAEDGAMWIERGQWDQKLAERKSASECKDIVGGFEDFCQSWREKLERGQTGPVGVA